MPPRSSSNRDRLLSQPRSGARPLGGSPGPSRPRQEPPPTYTARTIPRRGQRQRQAQPSGAPAEEEPRKAAASSRAAPRAESAGPGNEKGQRDTKRKRQRDLPGGPRRSRSGSPGKAPAYHNYQAIILAEFVAAELLVAATPIATRKNQPGLSPYVPRDLVKLLAIGVSYFILQLFASGAKGTGRIAAWFGGLVLLAVGLNEASKLGAVFDTLTGGKGNAKTTAVLTAKSGSADAPLTSYTQPELGQPPPGSSASPNASAGRRSMTGGSNNSTSGSGGQPQMM